MPEAANTTLAPTSQIAWSELPGDKQLPMS